ERVCIISSCITHRWLHRSRRGRSQELMARRQTIPSTPPCCTPSRSCRRSRNRSI
ncbi:hypothetical protein GUJ93_ZPchr0013g35281, partial [Zizania palustris]